MEPLDGAHFDTDSVTLSCDALDEVDRYAFEIQSYSVILDAYQPYWTYETSRSSQTFWPAIDDVAYRWRVRAHSAEGWGADSPWRTFLFGDTVEP